MKHIYYIALIASCLLVSSCSLLRSGASGNTDTDIPTRNISINRYDLDVDPQGVVYTIDISTPEGQITLEGRSLKEAKEVALEQAAIKSNCAKIVDPKFSYLKKGKQILRITVFGFPARYKNSDKIAPLDREPQKDNVIIIK